MEFDPYHIDTSLQHKFIKNCQNKNVWCPIFKPYPVMPNVRNKICHNTSVVVYKKEKRKHPVKLATAILGDQNFMVMALFQCFVTCSCD